MTQETAIRKEPIDITISSENKASEKEKQLSLQELIESLKSTAEDIGQISELTSEEKILVTQFFSAFLKLSRPLTSSMTVSPSALPASLSDTINAYLDPTGHLAIQFSDGHMELKDLSSEINRDLMISVIYDVMPKFKILSSMHKRKIENRIKTLLSITKELQKSADSLPSLVI